MQTEVILYTQDHRPLLLVGTVPSPLGQYTLEVLKECCTVQQLSLSTAELGPDRLTFTLEGTPTPPQIRRLLTPLRQQTAAFYDRQFPGGYTAVLWQRMPEVRNL